MSSTSLVLTKRGFLISKANVWPLYFNQCHQLLVSLVLWSSCILFAQSDGGHSEVPKLNLPEDIFYEEFPLFVCLCFDFSSPGLLMAHNWMESLFFFYLFPPLCSQLTYFIYKLWANADRDGVKYKLSGLTRDARIWMHRHCCQLSVLASNLPNCSALNVRKKVFYSRWHTIAVPLAQAYSLALCFFPFCNVLKSRL